MKFLCECGYVIRDSTDYLSYKGYVISDQDWFDFLDEIDEAVEKSGPTQNEKESALMKVRSLACNLTKTVYQCPQCGNVFFNTESPTFEIFRGCEGDVNKKLLQSVKGDIWQGFLFGEWVDDKPVWLEKNGYISAPNLIDGEQYDEWEALERDYYKVFDELRNKNVLRCSSLKKNKEVIHKWDLKDD